MDATLEYAAPRLMTSPHISPAFCCGRRCNRTQRRFLASGCSTYREYALRAREARPETPASSVASAKAP